MSGRKKASKTQNNNTNNEEAFSSEKMANACVRCKAGKKKCDKKQPSCSLCLKKRKECIYRKKFDTAMLNRISETDLAELNRTIQLAQQFNIDMDEELKRLVEEIERMKRAKNNLVVRSVTLYKCSKLIYMLNCYMPALQPTTGNHVPYIKISHFLRDTNPARQGAMFAMLANAALMLEDIQLAARFRAEAKNCLKIAGYPNESNMALVVSALIDLGTHHQAFFRFEKAIKIYYKIWEYADRYPKLFLAALHRKRAEQRSMAFQSDRFQVLVLQEKDHYGTLFQELRTRENQGYDDSSTSSPNITKHLEDDDLDLDLNPDDDGKTTYAVPSYALPRSEEESLFFHLGYAFEALMMMTRDQELEKIRAEIKKDLDQSKLGEHNVFNEIRERLQDLNQIATFCLKRGVIMKWDWFQAELEYIEERLLEVEMGRKIFLHGQMKLVVIHGLMAAHKNQEALGLLDQLIDFGEQQFYYGKTNVLGFGYLFSACVCFHFLGDAERFIKTKEKIEGYRIPGIPLAERCLQEIDKFVSGKEEQLAPYFAKLAAILEVQRMQQTKFTLLEITGPDGELTDEARHYFPKNFEFKGRAAVANKNNNNNDYSGSNINIQPQGPWSCESSPNPIYVADQLQTPPIYSPNNTNTQDAYNSNMPFVPSSSVPQYPTTPDHAYAMVHEQDFHLQSHEEDPLDDFTTNIIQEYMDDGNVAPHLMQNTQQIQSGVTGDMFYVVPISGNNNNSNINMVDNNSNNNQNQGLEQTSLFHLEFAPDQPFSHDPYESHHLTP